MASHAHPLAPDAAGSPTADGSGLSGPVLARIRSVRPSLSRTGTRIAETVLEQPGRVAELTVTDLATAADTSVASVVRFCQDLGLRGYQDLRLRLAAESAAETAARGAAPAPRPAHDDTVGAVFAASLRSTARSIAQAVEALDRGAIEPVVSTLARSRKVLVVGVGTSAPVATDAAYRLLGHGIAAEASADPHVQHVGARLLGAEGACLAVSHSGRTRETLTAVAAARESGAATLAITSYARSPLAELCDHVVVAGASEPHYRLEARTSRLMHLVVLDALLAGLAHAEPVRAQTSQATFLEAVTEHRV